MRHSSLGTCAIAALGLALASTGCESSSGSGGQGGKVMHRDQQQHTTPDGTQVRERSQMRQTKDGGMVKETQTETRQPVTPGTAQ